MRNRIPLLTLLLLSFLHLTAAQETEKPLYNATGNEATLTGAIIVTGTMSGSKLEEVNKRGQAPLPDLFLL